MTDTARMLKLLIFLATLLVTVQASDDPPFIVTNAPTDPSNSTAPTLAPSVTSSPSSTPDLCRNTPGFEVTEWNKFYREWHLQTLGCDDILVDCFEYGNLGPAKDHCCKCRPGCTEQCNELVFTEPSEQTNQDNSSGGTMFFMLFIPGASFVGLCVLFGLWLLRKKEQRIERENMAARRLAIERRENNGLTEEENEHVRFEQFVTKFYFQKVSEDKSNISAESIRSSNETSKDEETPAEKSTSFDESDESGNDDQQDPSIATSNTISEYLSNWIQPAAKHECCICLDAYVAGETICAPANKSCNHVFHESCIKQWLKKNDHCPLCRIDIFAD